jgi:hypothetical protein
MKEVAGQQKSEGKLGQQRKVTNSTKPHSWPMGMGEKAEDTIIN